MGKRSAKHVGASPATLYIYVENVDKVVDKATKLGATGQGPVMDMFWGDRAALSWTQTATAGWSLRTKRNPRLRNEERNGGDDEAAAG